MQSLEEKNAAFCFFDASDSSLLPMFPDEDERLLISLSCEASFDVASLLNSCGFANFFDLCMMRSGLKLLFIMILFNMNLIHHVFCGQFRGRDPELHRSV